MEMKSLKSTDKQVKHHYQKENYKLIQAIMKI